MRPDLLKLNNKASNEVFKGAQQSKGNNFLESGKSYIYLKRQFYFLNDILHIQLNLGFFTRVYLQKIAIKYKFYQMNS